MQGGCCECICSGVSRCVCTHVCVEGGCYGFIDVKDYKGWTVQDVRVHTYSGDVG